MKKINKVNPLTHFNNAKTAVYKKASKEMDNYKKSLPKAQDGKIVKPTADSTAYYTRRMLSDMDMSYRSSGDTKKHYDLKFNKDVKDLNRQKLKGKPGYDKNGFLIKKTSIKNK